MRGVTGGNVMQKAVFPVEPLLRQIKLALPEMEWSEQRFSEAPAGSWSRTGRLAGTTTHHSGWMALACRYAARFGFSEKTADRTIDRLLAAEYITPVMADRLACLLGLHPVLIWGYSWLSEPDEDAA